MQVLQLAHQPKESNKSHMTKRKAKYLFKIKQMVQQIRPQGNLPRTSGIINSQDQGLNSNLSSTLQVEEEGAEEITLVVEGAAEVTNVRINKETILDTSNPTNLLEVGEMTPVTKQHLHNIHMTKRKSRLIDRGTKEVAIGEDMETKATKVREAKATKVKGTKATNAM